MSLVSYIGGVSTSVPSTIAKDLTLNGTLAITNQVASSVPLTVTGASGQIANLLELKNNAGTTVYYVDVSGNVTFLGDEYIADALTVNDNLSVSGISTLTGLVTVSTGLIVSAGGITVTTGDSNFGGKITCDSLKVDGGKAEITNILYVDRINERTASAEVNFGNTITPTTSDGSAIGNTSKMWADLFLASGAVINFNNGNYTVTHSAGTLTTNGALAISGALTVGGNVNIAPGAGEILWGAYGGINFYKFYSKDGADIYGSDAYENAVNKTWNFWAGNSIVTTNEAASIGIYGGYNSTDGSRFAPVIIGSAVDRNAEKYAVAFTAQTEPTFAVFGAVDPDTRTTDWIALSHDASNGIISTGVGGVSLTPVTLTAGGTADYALNVTRTLNDSGAAGGTDLFTGILLNVIPTDVTGWDTLYLMDLQYNTGSVFSVDTTGEVASAGDIVTMGAVRPNKVQYITDFTGLVGEWINWVSTGSKTLVNKVNGWYRFTTGATATNEQSVHLNNKCSFINTQRPSFEFLLQLEQTANVEVDFGLMEDTGVGSNDYIRIYYDASAGANWNLEASTGGVTTADAGAAATANVTAFRVVFTSDTTLEWFISTDGGITWTSQGVAASNIPIVALQPFIRIKTEENAAHYVDFDYVSIWQDRI